jgi:hypothetical protein
MNGYDKIMLTSLASILGATVTLQQTNILGVNLDALYFFIAILVGTWMISVAVIRGGGRDERKEET